MSKSEQATGMTVGQQRVLDALEREICTWDDLRARLKMNDEHLGFRIGELLDQRKIWTAMRGNNRVYGIERRRGLVPRFARIHQRRESDTRN